MSEHDYESKIAEGHHRLVRERELTHTSRLIGQQNFSSIQRYVVLDIIPDPTIIDDAKIEYYKSKFGEIGSRKNIINISTFARLARNSIIAAPVLGEPQTEIGKPIFLLPFFPPHISLPCNPGEHVWALFESSKQYSDVGYWICRITAPYYVDDLNHTHAPRETEVSFFPSNNEKLNNKATPTYNFDNQVSSVENKDEKVSSRYYINGENDAYEKIIKEAEAKNLIKNEAVPRIKKRPGDLVLQGSNNASIYLGTDRDGSAFDVRKIDVEVKNKEKATIQTVDHTFRSTGEGTIDIVAGKSVTESITTSKIPRKEIAKSIDAVKRNPNEGDPDYVKDSSRVYVSQRTNVDEKLKLTSLNDDLKNSYDIAINVSDNGDAAIIQKSDKIRIVGRQDVNIVVTNDDNDTNAVITITKDGSILIRNTKKIILESNNIYVGNHSASEPIPLGNKLVDWLQTHTHPAVGGATLPPSQPIDVLSKKNTVD
jgi:hypothetical protein